MNLTLHEFELPLRHVFTISRGSRSMSRTLIVELEQDGVRGFGEAGENTYYRASIGEMSAALEQVLSSGAFLFSFQELTREKIAQEGDWGVTIAMGPGISIETGLIRW